MEQLPIGKNDYEGIMMSRHDVCHRQILAVSKFIHDLLACGLTCTGGHQDALEGKGCIGASQHVTSKI